MKQIQFIVIDENTLCYTIPELPNTAGILRASVLRGSHYNELTGDIIIPSRNVRQATRQDFKDYMVSYAQYENNPLYQQIT